MTDDINVAVVGNESIDLADSLCSVLLGQKVRSMLLSQMGVRGCLMGAAVRNGLVRGKTRAPKIPSRAPGDTIFGARDRGTMSVACRHLACRREMSKNVVSS